MSAFLLALVILLLLVVLLCIGHVRNCCPDAYHETPTSCVSQSRLKSGAVDRGGAGLLSWNIYNASSAIYYAVPVQGLSGQAESAAMSTHQRCHLAPQASNQSPKDSVLSFSFPRSLPPSLLWKDLCTRVMAAQMATLSFDELPPSWGHTEGRFMPPSQRTCPTAVFWQPLLLLLMLLLWFAVAVAVLIVVVLDISVCLSFGCCCSSCQATLLLSALLFVLCLFLFSSLKNFVNLITLRVS